MIVMDELNKQDAMLQVASKSSIIASCASFTGERIAQVVPQAIIVCVPLPANVLHLVPHHLIC